MLQHRAHLLERNAWKPFDELGRRSAVLQVLEERGNGDPSTAEDPGATYEFRVPLNGWDRPTNRSWKGMRAPRLG